MITTSTLEKTLRKHTKKTGTVKVKSTSCEAKKIFRKLSIDDRLKKMQENEAFITIKDHEEGFSHHVSCRLLNPWKNQHWKNQQGIIRSNHVSRTF